MRWLLVVAVVFGGCGATQKLPLTVEVRTLGTSRLLAATSAGDATALAKLLHPNLTYAGVWFADPACRQQFSTPGTIQPTGIAPLAKCLTTLPFLTKSDRANPFPDIGVFTYGPGIEIEVLFENENGEPKVKWIGFVSRRETKDALPTVTQRALERLRVDTSTLDGHARAELDREISNTPRAEREFGWFKVCVDVEGVVTSAHPRMATSLVANDVFVTLIKQWRFRPFLLGAQPTPVCSLVHVEYPVQTNRTENVFPYPVSDVNAIVVSQAFMNRTRKGETLIVPRDAEKVVLQNSNARRIIGLVLYCIDTTGAVTFTSMSRSSGLAGYDRDLMRGVSKWRFSPVIFDGIPKPVCSHAVFIYSQR